MKSLVARALNRRLTQTLTAPARPEKQKKRSTRKRGSETVEANKKVFRIARYYKKSDRRLGQEDSVTENPCDNPRAAVIVFRRARGFSRMRATWR